MPISSRVPKWIVLLAGLAITGTGYGLPPFQLFVEITPPGGVLRAPAGKYAGPVVIKRPITIEGDGQITIDGGGEGTVLSVEADDVVIRGLQLVNSGDSHDQVDAAILVAADNVLIENNRISDTLFGVHIRQANDNIIRNNMISSKGETPSLRGEGIRMWYSEGNLIEGNEIMGVRDLVFLNSPENRIVGNTITNSRIGMEFVFSPDNLVEDNRIEGNSTGVVVIYSDDLRILGNRFSHLRSISGSAVSIKGSAKALIEDNLFLHCAIGLVANAPIHPEHVFNLKDNRFIYNDVAMYFYGEKGGHVVRDNHFEGNFTDILVSASSSALHNDWHGNYWDNYKGFDRDRDGFGDAPYNMYVYSDRLWMDRPMTRFFRGSPGLEIYDFVERLAPFSKPVLILSDPRPRMAH
ncbi:MAG: nitrous oxide reductase family maturation protein NosD [Candidatus Sedimenticola sp. 6PFRAG1]